MKETEKIVDKLLMKLKYTRKLRGSFFGFLKGTNFAPIAKVMEGPNIKPLASIPAQST